MERKKINTILITAVALIWGVVLYKFISPYFSDPPVTFTVQSATKKRTVASKIKDTVVLIYPARDPFLGRVSRPKAKTTKQVSKPRTTKPKPAINFVWPTVDYMGFVKSKTSKNPLGLVRIDGKLHRVHLNAVANGLKVTKINGDFIQLTHGKNSKEFKKQ
nr:hypothetical protein [Allomuricauda sp.]